MMRHWESVLSRHARLCGTAKAAPRKAICGSRSRRWFDDLSERAVWYLRCHRAICGAGSVIWTSIFEARRKFVQRLRIENSEARTGRTDRWRASARSGSSCTSVKQSATSPLARAALDWLQREAECPDALQAAVRFVAWVAADAGGPSPIRSQRAISFHQASTIRAPALRRAHTQRNGLAWLEAPSPQRLRASARASRCPIPAPISHRPWARFTTASTVITKPRTRARQGCATTAAMRFKKTPLARRRPAARWASGSLRCTRPSSAVTA
jgi:hypothetical protein